VTRRWFTLLIAGILASVLTILAYVALGRAYPSPNCSLDDCTVPIVLTITIPGIAAFLAAFLLRVVAKTRDRVALKVVGAGATLSALILEFPRELREPSGHPIEAAIGVVLMFFVFGPVCTVGLLLAAERLSRHSFGQGGLSEESSSRGE